MRYATGLPTAEFADLLTRLREEDVEGYPPSLGLRDSLRAAPIRMHHNVVHAVHAVIGEQSGVCRPTISRAIEAMTDAIIRALKDVLLTAGEVPEGCDFCLDGTLLPPAEVGGITANCGRGERGTTGMSVRILVLSGGRLVGGPPTPARGPCTTWPPQAPSGLLEGIDTSGWIADKGYIGRGMITPHKNPPTAS